jgi:hypothetical protein
MPQLYSFAALTPHSQAATQTTIDKSLDRQRIVAVWIQSAVPLSSAKTFRVATAC